MKKIWDLRKVVSNLELEGQGYGIIMGVTPLLLLGPFYTIQTNFMYFFAHDSTLSHISIGTFSYFIIRFYYRAIKQKPDLL